MSAVYLCSPELVSSCIHPALILLCCTRPCISNAALPVLQQGLSILSRRQQPSHTLPFLHALLEIASGVAQEAHTVQQQLQQTLDTLAQRAAAQEAARQQQEAEREHAAEQAAAAAAAAAGGGVGGAHEARSYFMRRVEQKQHTEGMPGGVAIEGAGEGGEQEDGEWFSITLKGGVSCGVYVIE